MTVAITRFVKRVVPPGMRPRLRAIYKKVLYFGFRYKCPFCGSHVRRFLPFGLTCPVLEEAQVVGGGYRQNALCPMCASLDRERLIYLYLLHKTNTFAKPVTVLHVAPEARLAAKLRERANIDYLTADIAGTNVMLAMDITDIRFADGSFDAIICNHVLEHVIDDRKAMGELFRTLKPGGWAILQVPISLRLANTYEDFTITTVRGREQAFGQGDHVRLYGNDYQERLAKAGFEVTVFRWVTEAEKFGGRRNAFGLNEEECVYFVRKRQ